jgi:hypothetical protein
MWVLIYHIIYNYSRGKELSKERSKAMKICLIIHKYKLLIPGKSSIQRGSKAGAQLFGM